MKCSTKKQFSTYGPLKIHFIAGINMWQNWCRKGLIIQIIMTWAHTHACKIKICSYTIFFT